VGPDEEGWEVRAFFARGDGTVFEDPVTGSLNASVGQYLFGAGLAQGAYVARQDARVAPMGAAVRQDGDDVWVAGALRACLLAIA
jgi:predicted PhzF superfamily epimerase YddE/YHI9